MAPYFGEGLAFLRIFLVSYYTRLFCSRRNHFIHPLDLVIHFLFLIYGASIYFNTMSPPSFLFVFKDFQKFTFYKTIIYLDSFERMRTLS